MAAATIDRGDPADIETTIDLFERNVEKARVALQGASEELQNSGR